MCGIAGYFGLKPLDDGTVRKGLKMLAHRGPNGQGVYQTTTKSGHHLYLLHTRLAIIDLDPRSNQPMTRDHGVLSLNGEIYNYKECRQELTDKYSTKFSTTSDTEVLLQMFLTYGIEASLPMAEGMWAVAYYDSKDETLHLSRDRFGEKPLFYFQSPDGFYFASELNSLFALLGKTPAVNGTKLQKYLFEGYRSLHHDSYTYFENVHAVPQHEILKIQPGRSLTKSSFWNPVAELKPLSDVSEAIDQTKNALLEAVELRLRSDVPIAFCMSGGIDSLSLISIAKRIFGYDVHGFTIQNQDQRYDESVFVDDAVKELKIRHSYVNPAREPFLETLDSMIHHRAGPVSTISYYVHHSLMREIQKAGYKVSISGTGADEIFTGYYDHFLYYLSGLPDSKIDKSVAQWTELIKPHVRNPMFQDPFLFKSNPTARDYLHSDYSAHAKNNYRVGFKENKYHREPLRNRMLNELFHEVVPVILFEDDNNAMQFSVENRSPFLDTALFNLSLQIPSEWLIQEGFSKYILRETMKGILPEKERVNRKKTGFNASLFELLPRDFIANVGLHLKPTSKVFEWIDRDKVIHMIQNRTPNEKFLFNFLCVKFFLERYA